MMKLGQEIEDFGEETMQSKTANSGSLSPNPLYPHTISHTDMTGQAWS